MKDSDLSKLAEEYRESLSMADTLIADGQSHEVFRCRADGELVFNTKTSLARHAGHLMHKPVKLTDTEKKLIGRVNSIEELEKLIYA